MMTKLIIASLALAAATACAQYEVPTNAPPTLPVPNPVACTNKVAKDAYGFTFGIFMMKWEYCMICYAYRLSFEGEGAVHTFALQRSNPNYNGGQWEQLSIKTTSLSLSNAQALFSDRLDRDDPPTPGLTSYRVADLGPYVP